MCHVMGRKKEWKEKKKEEGKKGGKKKKRKKKGKKHMIDLWSRKMCKIYKIIIFIKDFSENY